MKFTVVDTKVKNWYSDLDYVEEGGFRGDFGYVYILEAGENVKIGCTCRLKDRYSALTSWLERYAGISCGRFAISERHRSFRHTEHVVHKFMELYRLSNSEMFKVTFDDALKILETFEYDTKTCDESEKARKERSQKAFDALTSLLFPKMQPANTDQIDFDKVAMDLYNSLDKYLERKFREDIGLDPDTPSPMELLEAMAEDEFSYIGTKFEKKEMLAVDVGLFLSELCKMGGDIRVTIDCGGETYEFGVTHN